MAFRVGQEVVCVDDDSTPGKYGVAGHFYRNNLHGIRKGQIYTIREIVSPCEFIASGLGLRLNEILRPDIDTPYSSARFRPVVKTNIEIFTAMLAPSPKQRADADA